MKKVTLLILLIFCACIFCGCKGKTEPEDLLSRIKFREKIIVGIKVDSKPFSYVKNNELIGFDVDIAKNISRKLLGDDTGKKIEFVYVTPDSRISDLNSKKVDMIISTMSINPKRAAIIDFTNPYYVAGQAIMIKRGSRVKSIESLNDKRAGIVLGTTGEKTIRQMAPNATVIGSKTYIDAFRLLQTGKIDALLADDTILYGFIMDNRGYTILPRRYTKEYYAIAIRKEKDTEKLKEELNDIIDHMQQSGRLNRIKEKWIPNLHRF